MALRHKRTTTHYRAAPVAPTLTSIAPNPGPAGPVTLTGTNFIAGATVSFGGGAATSVVVVSNTQITCVAPAHADGAVNVTVTTTGGTSSSVSFTYQATAVIATNIHSTQIDLTWTPIGATVTSVGRDGTDILGNAGGWSGVPPGTPATQPFTLKQLIPGTLYALNAVINGIQYNTTATTLASSVPAITSLSPNTGSAGLTVVVNGTDFLTSTTVSFGGTAATNVMFVSTQQITCTAPVHAFGSASVTVTTSAGTSASQSFTYAVPKAATLVDNFVTRNTTLWNWGAAADVVVNGQLSLPVNNTFSGNIASVSVYDLTSSSVYAKIVQLPNVGSGTTQMFISLGLDANNAYLMKWTNGNLIIHSYTTATQPNGTILSTTAYNATSMLWWRVREASGTIFFETSPDASIPTPTWTTRFSQTNAFSLSALTVILQTGCGTETTPGTGIFSSFNTTGVIAGTGVWLSGANQYSAPAGATGAGGITDFETWRGRLCAYNAVFTDRGNWGLHLDNWWHNNRARPSQGINLAIPLWAQDGLITDVVTANWTTLASQLQAGDVVRPGWEMNGNWFYWAITGSNWTAWQACWIRMYNAMKAANPNILICLNMSWGDSGIGVSNNAIAAALAPYYDLIGIDLYWTYLTAGDTLQSWNDRTAIDGGLTWLLTQAQTYNKKMSLGEWGIASVADVGTGDETLFIDKMFQWFHNNVAYMHSECYFNNSAYSAYLLPTTLNPNAGNAYKADVATYLNAFG